MRRKALFWTAGLLAPLMVVALPMLMVVAMLASTGGDDEAADDSPGACTEAVDDSTETGPAQTTGSDQLANGLKVAQAFADAGYTKESTAGVIANLIAESGIDPTKGETGGSGYGIAQWTPKSKLQAKMDGMGIGNENMDSFDTQVKVLVHYAKGDFNNNYLGTVKSEHPDWVIDNDLYKSWYNATTPQAAAFAWMAGWERPDWAKSHKETRIQTAVDWYRNKLDGISFQTSPTADKNAGADSDAGTEDTAGGEVIQAGCKSEDGQTDGGQTNGGEGIGDAPVGEGDFGWLCKALENKYKRDICVEGTTQLVGGNGGFNGVTSDYKWQCVLYAWLRAYLVYGDKGWTPITGGSCGSGGHIAECAAGNPAWNVSSTPHAGDLMSSFKPPFASNGPYGHIAFVEEVQEGTQYGGWRIRISEGNHHSDGRWAGYNGRWLTASQLSKQLADGKKPFISNKAWKK